MEGVDQSEMILTLSIKKDSVRTNNIQAHNGTRHSFVPLSRPSSLVFGTF